MSGAERNNGASQWLWLSLIVIVADQLSKWWIRARFDLYDRVEVLPWLDITRLHNTGAAFSFLSDAGGWQRWFFIGISVVVSTIFLVWLVRLPMQSWLTRYSLTFIVGGALVI